MKIILFLIIALFDYNIVAKSHCGTVYKIENDSNGNPSVVKDEECITTPSDWKDDDS